MNKLTKYRTEEFAPKEGGRVLLYDTHSILEDFSDCDADWVFLFGFDNEDEEPEEYRWAVEENKRLVAELRKEHPKEQPITVEWMIDYERNFGEGDPSELNFKRIPKAGNEGNFLFDDKEHPAS